MYTVAAHCPFWFRRHTQCCWPFVLPVDFCGKIEHNALQWLLLLGLVLEAAVAAAVAPCFMVNRIVYLRSRSATAALLLRNLNFSIEKITRNILFFFAIRTPIAFERAFVAVTVLLFAGLQSQQRLAFSAMLKMSKWPRIRWNRHRVGIVRSMMTLIAAPCHTCIDACNDSIKISLNFLFFIGNRFASAIGRYRGNKTKNVDQSRKATRWWTCALQAAIDASRKKSVRV